MFHGGVSSHHIEHVNVVTPSIEFVLWCKTLYGFLKCCLVRRSCGHPPLFTDRFYDSEAELPLGLIAQIQDIIYLASYGIVRRPLFESHQHLSGNPESLGYSSD
jgi:hypothetical protein